MPLKRLSIKNLAIIENLEIFFEDGLNIITGETGAGKSIIISSLKLILGQKPDTGMIRAGEDKLTVEAEFCNISKEAIDVLNENGIETGDSIILRREISASKKSRLFANDSPIRQEVLSDLGNILIDIHGQHDHQSLLNKDTHIDILDDFAKISTEKISKIYYESIRLKKDLDTLISLEKEQNSRRELLSYHFKEISETDPQENEDSEIFAEIKKMESIEDIKKLCRLITDTADGAENSLLSGINFIKAKCSELAEIDKQFEPFISDLDSSYQAIKEFSSTSENYSGSLEFDETEFDRLNQRYMELKKLMKKFGPELKDVIAYKNSVIEKLSKIENISSDKDKLIEQIGRIEKDVESECARLNRYRNDGIKKLEKAINSEFKDIGLTNAEISINISKKEISDNGYDDVEFYIRTNVGEESKPLSKTASGGEISRVMLSIKNIVSSEKGVPTVVFDEIDSGISGQIAEKVGSKLQKLSEKKQVIVITHLPAIASKGSHHFSVRKKIVKDRTAVDVIKLNKEQRIQEIASLITSEKAGDDSKKLAKKLLEVM